MGRKSFVPIATKSDGSRVVQIDTDATNGATFGINLFIDDGNGGTRLLTIEDLQAPPDDGGENPELQIIWKQISEIPQNIIELAKIAGSGFAYRNTDGTWRLRRVGRQVIPFAYGDASPAAIFTPLEDSVFVLCRVVFDEAFDGAGAEVKVGTAADPELLMPGDQNSPMLEAAFEATPDEEIAAGTDVLVTLTPGSGASAGAGRIVIDSIPVEGI